MDSAEIAQAGIQALKTFLDSIAEIHDASPLENAMVALNREGVSRAFGLYVDQDTKNSASDVLQISQSGHALPEREFFFKQEIVLLIGVSR